MKEFAILHETKETQISIIKSYEPDNDTHHIQVKAYSKKINGYVTISPQWAGKYEIGVDTIFNKLKDIKYAQAFIERYI